MAWRIDKTINIGNAITAFTIAMSMIWWAAQVEKRVAILEVKTDALVKALLQAKELQGDRDARQEADIAQLENLEYRRCQP
jgi:hypothetical protein